MVSPKVTFTCLSWSKLLVSQTHDAVFSHMQLLWWHTYQWRHHTTDMSLKKLGEPQENHTICLSSPANKMLEKSSHDPVDLREHAKKGGKLKLYKAGKSRRKQIFSVCHLSVRVKLWDEGSLTRQWWHCCDHWRHVENIVRPGRCWQE